MHKLLTLIEFGSRYKNSKIKNNKSTLIRSSSKFIQNEEQKLEILSWGLHHLPMLRCESIYGYFYPYVGIQIDIVAELFDEIVAISINRAK